MQTEKIKIELPDACFSINNVTFDLIKVKKRESGFYPYKEQPHEALAEMAESLKQAGIENPTKEQIAEALCEKLNNELGVTRGQREAMEWGSMFGWGVPLADPNNYDEAGNLIDPKKEPIQIILSPEKSEEYFHTALCNALGNNYGQYNIEHNKKLYDAARANVDGTSAVCREDVWMQILKDGGFLQFRDKDGEKEYDRKIYLTDVHEKVSKTPIQHLTDMMNENDDAVTADMIIQTVLYGKIVFG